MAINVKRQKRILRSDSSPYREVMLGDENPRFRHNDYKLDFTNVTGGKITFNGVDYPQTSVILSFSAEGKTWLFGESIGASIESETGDIATISINESTTILNSEVWQKKSFALELDSANQEYLKRSSAITCNTNEPLKFTFNLDSIGTQFDICSESNSASNSRITVLSSGNVYLRVTGSATVNTGLSAISGINTIELNFNGTDNDITVNGTTVNMPSCTSPFIISQIGKRGLFYADIELYSFSINNEDYKLREGLGNEVIGSDGTVWDIETNHVDGMRRINYGMWKKNSYVVTFNRSNQDDGKVNVDHVIDKFHDLDLELTFVCDTVVNNLTILSSGKFNNANTGWLNLRQRISAGNKVQLQASGLSNSNTIDERWVVVVGQTYTLTIKNGVATIDGDSRTITDFDLDLDTDFSAGTWLCSQDGSSTWSDTTIKDFSLQDEKFDFDTFQGATISGDSGNTITLNTSHVDGSSYIDTMWSKDNNKWIDYN